MAMQALWIEKDQSLPVERIMYRRLPNATLLTMQCRDQNRADIASRRLEALDPGIRVKGAGFAFSSEITPEHLACFLLEHKLIGQQCFDEIQYDMKKQRRGMGDDSDWGYSR